MKKNIKRILSLCAISLCFLTSCSVTNEKSSVNDNNKEEVKHLNVTQANLIAEITDNEKYLNPNLLYDLKDFEDSDKVGVIVTLSSSGIADTYFDNSNGYSSIADYAVSKKGVDETTQMTKEQTALADYLIKKNLINSTKHSYTTLFNGFSAETTYGQYKKLKKAGLAQDVAITEVYAKPLTVSTDSNVVENIVDVYPTGIFNSSTVKYDGENTAVAVLDSGFDIYHEVFRNMPKQPMIQKEDVNALLESTKASSFTKGLKVEDVYVNDKIPYAYDYADKDPDVAPYDSEHGTHVAGIIGGKSDVITGVAENTQLVLLKVFGDLISGAKEEDILAALEDAVLLKVDAINMSLGTACGFTRLQDNDYLNLVYDKIENAGISLVVAASNDYSSNYGGEESNTNKVTNPDSATVGSPSTYSASLSVASISGTKSKYIKADDGYVFFFNEANSLSSKPFDFYEMLNIPAGVDKEYEYVTVPGYGKKINYSMIDVKGKVALVKRGDISFEDKAKIAAEEGAIACIVYNNIGGDILMSAGNNLAIPFCSISKDDGEYLAKKANGKLIFNNGNEAGPFMSDFSSWGPTPDLKLKPEITAHGGNITSSIPGGEYDQLSGTSMAAPNMCGIVVLIRQYLKEKYDGISYTDLSKMTNQLLMSTATIALNEVGNPYSPRKQGAGLANLYNATNTKAYLTVDGSDKAKIELGDDPAKSGVYTLKFNIVNISNKNLTYTLSNLSMTESVSTSDSRFVAERAYMLNPSTSIKVSGAGSLNGQNITVDANGSAQVEYTLTLSEEEKKYIRKNFINGMFVEGYAALKAEDGEVDLSIPYLAFFGDWTVAPMFDKTYYEVETEAHNTGIDDDDKIKADYYATTPLGTYYYNYIIPLGSYVYTMDENAYDPIPATEEHAAIGYTYDTINGITCVYAGLLRGAKKMTTTITNSKTGEVVFENVKYNQLKAHYNGIIVPSYEMLDISVQELGLANNTNYTFTMKGELDYGENGGVDTNLNNEFSFSFYVDYEAPIITNTEFYYKYDRSLKKNRYYVDFYVYDNHYTQSIRPFAMVNGEFSSLVEYPIPVYGDKGTTNKVTMEITDYMDLLQYNSSSFGGALTNGLGIMVDDYAMNDNYYFITLPGTDVKDDGNTNNMLYFVGEDNTPTTSLVINVGEEYNLAKMIRSNDPLFDASSEVQEIYMSKLNWTSSDENVVKVKDGKIEAVASGRATITAQTVASNGYGYTASIAIIARGPRTVDSRAGSMAKQMSFTNNVSLEEIKFTYFDTVKAFIEGPERSEIGETGDRNFFTEKSSITFYPSEQVKIGYEITPWNLDPSRYSLTWSSNNPEVASVDEAGLVTALKEGSATITLRITVDGKLSSLIARTRVTVKNEFIIEGRTLTGYKGFGGDVVIPDDKGILYIGAFAFSLYTTDMTIKVDEEDWDKNKTPGTNDSIRSVVIPSGVSEVQKYAFYNCSALEEVKFLKNEKDETCKKIKEFAFYKNTNLKKINLENVQNIGESAFEGCSLLEAVNLSNIYSLGKSAFKGCNSITNVNITTLRNAWADVFMNCTNLTTVTSGQFTKFSEGMFTNSGLTNITIYADRIPDKTFLNCNNLIDVDIINDIVYVGNNAFEGCSKLNKVTFRGACDYIYSNAFKGNTSLTSIELPNSSVSIESYAFFNCSKLSSVKLGSNTRISDNFGTVFSGCDSLDTFIVDSNNPYYSAADNYLLTDKENTTIIFAAPKFNFGNYTIPANITKIADGAFSGNSNLTSLNLGNVIEVGKFAFAECTRLESVVFPQEELTLKQGAFQACIKLSAVENLNCVQEIAPYSFASTAIVTLQLGDNVIVGDAAFEKITALKLVTLGENTTLEYASFRGCAGLTQVNLAGSLEVKEEAFYGCTKLANIDLSKAINTIGKNAFYNCQSLKTVVLTNITRVEDFAFGDCSNITVLEIPKVEYIGDAAFAAVSETSVSGGIFSEVVFPESLKYIGEAAFYSCINLRSVSLPNVTEIKGFAFAYCTSLQSVTLNPEIKDLPERIFFRDTALVSVDTKNVESIGESAFYDCNKLQNLNLDKVRIIGESAFYHCITLTEVNLPEAIELGDTAFLSSTGITTINMPKMESLGHQSLSNVGVGTIVIPQTIKYIASTAFFNNTKQTDFIYLDNNTPVNDGIINDYARLVNGALYTKSANEKLVLSSYPTGKTDTIFEVAENTSRIELYAAGNNPYITKIVLPDTLVSIGNMAFYGCNALTTVEFRSTVAPTLEGSLAGSESDYNYTEGKPAYDLLNKYLMLNGYYPFYYGQFKFMVGTNERLKLVLPSNSVEGYDNTLYSLYFDMNNVEKTTFVAKDKNTLNYLDKIVLVPTGKITLKDEKVITDARAAYNALKQNLKDFGYDMDELNTLYENLVRAEKDYNKLKTDQVSARYVDLIAEIKALGSEFNISKVDEYAKLALELQNIDENDKEYMDTSNVDNFKINYENYIKNLTEEVDTLKQISELPTYDVARAALVAGLSIAQSLLTCCFLIFGKRWFF